MKPPVVHQSVQPPAPDPANSADADQVLVDKSDRNAPSQGLVGSYGPLVEGADKEDKDGAGADERKHA